MRLLAAPLFLAAVFVGFMSEAQGNEKEKEVTLKGKICCPKCELAKADKCATCILVKEKDKEIIYLFDAKADKKYHEDICSSPKNGTVTGVLSKDKKTIMVK